MLPSDLTLTRYRDRWLVRVGSALVDVCSAIDVGRREAGAVAERMRAAGLLGRHEAPRAGSPSATPSPRTCSCGDCLACELATMRLRKGGRHVAA